MRGGPRVSGTSGQGADRYYNTPGAMGAQNQSVRTSVSAYGFGTGPQRKVERHNGNPGPGAYAMPGAFGGQQDSQKASAGAFSIGQANEKTSNAGAGSDVPAPGAYDLDSAFGRQQLGTKFSGCSYSMSGWNRGQEGAKPNGPGKYYDTNGAFGKQQLGDKGSVAAYTFGSGPGPGRGVKLDADSGLGPGHYFEGAPTRQKAGEAYSDVTRFGNHSMAKQSVKWTRHHGRTSTTPRDIDFVHTY